MNVVERGVRRFDRFQQRHAIVGFPIAVVQKFGNDQAGGKAALMAYYGLFALFPLLLLFATVLGYVLAGHENLQHKLVNSALADFPIIGQQLLQDAQGLKGGGWSIAIGIFGTIYGAQGIAQASLAAMNTVWNVPYRDWPNFVGRRLRGNLWLAVLGVATVASTTIAGFGSTWLHGTLGLVWATAVAFVINLGVFYAVFAVLTAKALGWRDVWLGVLLATLFWETLQSLGGLYVRHSLKHANEVYGFFGIVIGLLSWLFVAAQLTLLAAEVDVVRRYRLWPRSITQPPLTAADKATYERLALMGERRPEVKVSVAFTADADCRPLDELCPPPGSEPVPDAAGAVPDAEGTPSDVAPRDARAAD